MFKVVESSVGSTPVELTSGVTINQPVTVQIRLASGSVANTLVLIGDSSASCHWPVQSFNPNVVNTSVSGYDTTGTVTEQGADMRFVNFDIGPGDKIYAVYPAGGSTQVVAMFSGAND